MRSCIKPGCRWPAVATLSYRYATAEVWLSDLGEPHPATHDLCPHHADTMRVPRGWNLVDDRQPAEAVHEPSAAEIVERVTRLRTTVDTMLEQPSRPERSRYADLLDNLPTYEPEDDSEGSTSSDIGGMPTPVLVPVGVAHELAPIAREHRADPTVGQRRSGAPGPGADDTTAAHGDDDPDVVHETDIRGAVVVQLPLRTEDADDV